MGENDLDNRLAKLVAGLPPELSRAVKDKVDFYRTKKAFSDKELYSEARDLVSLEMIAYLDRREYLAMYNRRWLEHKLKVYIRDLVRSERAAHADMRGIARVNFDLNGLKALNDLGGHDAGNIGLRTFSNILKHGTTTLWLRNDLGLEVVVSAEGGDEFGLVINGNVDLAKHVDEITHHYVEETRNYDASGLLDFRDHDVREKIELLGLGEIPEDFKFELSTSVGVSLFEDALAEVPVSELEFDYNKLVTVLINKMFQIADKRGADHKSVYKKELAVSNPLLSSLYARMSREVLHLERELRDCRERVTELEKMQEKD